MTDLEEYNKRAKERRPTEDKSREKQGLARIKRI